MLYEVITHDQAEADLVVFCGRRVPAACIDKHRLGYVEPRPTAIDAVLVLLCPFPCTAVIRSAVVVFVV